MPETTPLIKAALNLRVGAGFDVYSFSHMHGNIKKSHQTFNVQCDISNLIRCNVCKIFSYILVLCTRLKDLQAIT